MYNRFFCFLLFNYTKYAYEYYSACLLSRHCPKECVRNLKELEKWQYFRIAAEPFHAI